VAGRWAVANGAQAGTGLLCAADTSKNTKCRWEFNVFFWAVANGSCAGRHCDRGAFPRRGVVLLRHSQGQGGAARGRPAASQPGAGWCGAGSSCCVTAKGQGGAARGCPAASQPGRGGAARGRPATSQLRHSQGKGGAARGDLPRNPRFLRVLFLGFRGLLITLLGIILAPFRAPFWLHFGSFCHPFCSILASAKAPKNRSHLKPGLVQTDQTREFQMGPQNCKVGDIFDDVSNNSPHHLLYEF
jgi:hypothetical protein